MQKLKDGSNRTLQMPPPLLSAPPSLSLSHPKGGPYSDYLPIVLTCTFELSINEIIELYSFVSRYFSSI